MEPGFRKLWGSSLITFCLDDSGKSRLQIFDVQSALVGDTSLELRAVDIMDVLVVCAWISSGRG
jgi:hypothetical protein